MPRTIDPSDFKQKDKEVSHQEYARTLPCNKVEISAPLHWLALGLHDFIRLPLISAFYGLCFMAAAVGIVLLIQWQGTHLVVMPALVVYMLIGPFLALGLYDAAWQRERGKESSLLHSMKATRTLSIGTRSTTDRLPPILSHRLSYWLHYCQCHFQHLRVFNSFNDGKTCRCDDSHFQQF